MNNEYTPLPEGQIQLLPIDTPQQDIPKPNANNQSNNEILDAPLPDYDKLMKDLYNIKTVFIRQLSRINKDSLNCCELPNIYYINSLSPEGGIR